jgi:hypothetical protein
VASNVVVYCIMGAVESDLVAGSGAARAGLIASSAAGLAAFALLFARLGVFRGDAGPNRLGEPNSGDREVEPVAEMFS